MKSRGPAWPVAVLSALGDGVGHRFHFLPDEQHGYRSYEESPLRSFHSITG